MMRELKEDFNTKYPTWIIAFCPDTASFFVTNQRHFFWQSYEDFNSKESAINYFENHIQYFVDIQNKLIPTTCNVNKVWLDNMSKWYEV